jgi:hypothetical protein
MIIELPIVEAKYEIINKSFEEVNESSSENSFLDIISSDL